MTDREDAMQQTVITLNADAAPHRIDELVPWRLMPAAHIEQQAA